MQVLSKISFDVVGEVPDFQLSEELLRCLHDDLRIEVDEDGRASLRRIVRDYLADQKRSKSAYRIDDLLTSLARISAGSDDLLRELQGGASGERGTMRQLLIAGANKRPPSADDDLRGTDDEVEYVQVGPRAIDGIQVALVQLSRASKMAALELQSAKDNEPKVKQPGAYGMGWKMFIPEIERWVIERGGSTQLGRNGPKHASEANEPKPFLKFMMLLLKALPSGAHRDIQSEQAVAKSIRDARPMRKQNARK